MNITEILSESDWLGTAEQIQTIEQFARDYPWEVRIEDSEFAADSVVASLTLSLNLHQDAEARLRAALFDSAEKERREAETETITITGYTAIEVAERAGLRLSKAADPIEPARGGLTIDEARQIATEDPSLVRLAIPSSGDRIDVGGGRVWIDHPEHGWIEMPAKYDAGRITEDDLVHDGALRRLSDREIRDIDA